MAQVSDWSTIEEQNVKLDDLTLSGEGGLYSNKIMSAVKKKFDDVDGKLSKVQGAYVFKGAKADMAALEAVTSPAVGDVYSVTALGGENYAWDGTTWDSLGTSDANVVHKSGAETVSGEKTFSDAIVASAVPAMRKASSDASLMLCGGRTANGAHGANIMLFGTDHETLSGVFKLHAGNAAATKELLGYPDGTLTWDGQDIQVSSDERIKTTLSAVPDAVLDAWGDVSWGQFQFLDAVEAKGEAARLHLGLIAQRVKAAFEARGLDACRYGILCHDERGATEESAAADLWMVRYAEAQSMEAAFQRRRADKLEARIASLEALVHGND